jgi:uncharacterized membrane protein
MPEMPNFEDAPLTRTEYITAMSHLYRGEMQRANSWRNRLDATTNWAVLTAAGMISFLFTNPLNSHVVVLCSNLAVMAYMVIEARRYRYFEVYRARVRMLEENFYIPIITRNLVSPMLDWQKAVAADLDRPKFKTSVLEAIGFRLRRNYWIIFAFVLGGWLMKVGLQPDAPDTLRELYDRVAVGPVPAWLVLVGGGSFYGSLVLLAMKGRHFHGKDPDDEVVGVEHELGQWKL